VQVKNYKIGEDLKILSLTDTKGGEGAKHLEYLEEVYKLEEHETILRARRFLPENLDAVIGFESYPGTHPLGFIRAKNSKSRIEFLPKLTRSILTPQYFPYITVEYPLETFMQYFTCEGLQGVTFDGTMCYLTFWYMSGDRVVFVKDGREKNNGDDANQNECADS